MGIFSGSSPFDHDVEKATDEKNMGDNWETILDVCDKVKALTTGPKDCLKAILKRLNHPNPHVAKQAVILLDACVSNCNKPFHLELASRDSEQELYKLQKKLHPQVATQLRQCIKKWAEGDFKTDSQLSLIPALYTRLRQEGADFVSTNEPIKKVASQNKDAAAKEEEDIARAIALSLKEAETVTKPSTSLYPSMAMATAPVQPAKESRKVRALYDFEAAEDNELTFKAGEILHVLDDSDPNWWKGSNQRGEGLFPANFVTPDLDAEPESFRESSANQTKRVQFNEQVTVATLEETPSETGEVEIDEPKIDRLLHLLHEADPTGERPDPDDLKSLEEACGAMNPLIDAELEKLDRRHAHLTKLSSQLVSALDMYHSLMRDLPATVPGSVHPMSIPPGPYFGTAAGPGPIKYPYPQTQGPPQQPPNPSLPPFANQPPPGTAAYGPGPGPHPPMPYAPMGPSIQPAANFISPYPGQPNY